MLEGHSPRESSERRFYEKTSEGLGVDWYSYLEMSILFGSLNLLVVSLHVQLLGLISLTQPVPAKPINGFSILGGAGQKGAGLVKYSPRSVRLG